MERLNRTIKEEFYQISFRKKLYSYLEEIQADLDDFMTAYNAGRTNQGKYCQGRTPLQTFTDGLELYQKHVFGNGVEERDAAQ